MKSDKTTAAAEFRRRAEEQLQNQSPSITTPLSPHETQRLLHELQIHQIELEMQNDELRHSQAELETGTSTPHRSLRFCTDWLLHCQ